jgi:hypothetical protein
MSHWYRRVGLAFALWLGVSVTAWLLGNEPRPGLLALYVGVGGAVVWLFVDVSTDAGTDPWPDAVADPVRDPGQDPRFGYLRHVVDQHLDSREVGDGLHKRLVDLIDHRLMSRHGLTREADPSKVTALLGPELSAITAARAPYPRLTPGHIDQLLQRIEDL